MLPLYVWPPIIIGALAGLCCGLLGTLIVFVEIYDHRRDRRQDVESAARIARFREVERVLAAEAEEDPWAELDRMWLHDLGIVA